jgi:hypothetical protein
VDLAVILALDPRLRRLVELVEREALDALDHRDQALLERLPEFLLLAVLLGAVLEGQLVQDAEAREAAAGLLGLHRRAVVAHLPPRQPALHDRLHQAVAQRLRVLVPVPLHVAGEPRVVVEHGEALRQDQFAARRHHAP